MVSGGFGWFRVVSCFINNAISFQKQTSCSEKITTGTFLLLIGYNVNQHFSTKILPSQANLSSSLSLGVFFRYSRHCFSDLVDVREYKVR